MLSRPRALLPASNSCLNLLSWCSMERMTSWVEKVLSSTDLAYAAAPMSATVEADVKAATLPSKANNCCDSTQEVVQGGCIYDLGNLNP